MEFFLVEDLRFKKIFVFLTKDQNLIDKKK